MNRKHDRLFLAALITMQIVALIFVYFLSTSRTSSFSSHSREILKQQALNSSEDKLRERLENIVLHIERQQKIAVKESVSMVQVISHHVEQLPNEEVIPHVKDMMDEFVNTAYGPSIQVMVYDAQAKQVLLFSKDECQDITEEYNTALLETYTENSAYHEMVSRDGMVVHFFACQQELDTVVKQMVYDIIHDSIFGEDGYVWVKQVLNYEGGNDYAIRLIHPHLKDTEGTYLSTSMEDINGKRMYETELEGIRQNGAVFHTYYFQKSNGEIGPKASYAILYEPYDWIIATGDPMEEVYAHAIKLDQYNQEVLSASSQNIILMLLAIFAADIVLIYLSNRRYSRTIQRYVEAQREENEKVFDIVTRHSDRELYKYDISSKTMIPWKNEKRTEDLLSHVHTMPYSREFAEQAKEIMPDSIFDVKEFFDRIHEEVPNGETEICLKLSDGSTGWYHLKYSILYDQEKPMFALVSAENVTDKHEVMIRADYDALTGLLRRDVGEEKIRAHIQEQRDSKGVLVMLDLDDLKGINDTMGHAFGDKAITGIADTLKEHFSADDLLIRFGGDEFMVFLSDAAERIPEVELSLGLLLRKLSSTYIGEKKERAIHCSVGFAAERSEGDSFEALYKRADMALYHVKRGGKNNFAFYDTIMEQDEMNITAERMTFRREK